MKAADCMKNKILKTWSTAAIISVRLGIQKKESSVKSVDLYTDLFKCKYTTARTLSVQFNL